MNGTFYYDNLLNSTSARKNFDSITLYLLVFILWPLTFFTIVGNILALWAFVTDSKIRQNVTNRYILCLTISDLTVGCFSLPFNNIWLHFGRWPLGEVVCKIWLIVDYVACYISVMAILLLSFDRFHWVYWPLKYRQTHTVTKATFLILTASAFAFLFSTIPILFWDIWVGEKRIDYSVDCEPETSYNFTYGVISVIFETIIPAIGISILNIMVYHKIRKVCLSRGRSFRSQSGKARKLKPQSSVRNEQIMKQEGTHSVECEELYPDVKNQGKSKDEYFKIHGKNSRTVMNSYINGYRKAGKRLASMVGIFLFCWTPFNIVLVASTLCNNCIRSATWEAVNYLLWANSAINPVVYVITNERYKRRMLSIFCRQNNESKLKESTDMNIS